MSADGSGVGTVVGTGIGTTVGTGIGSGVGNGDGRHADPIEFPVVINQLVTPLESAWTSVGTSQMNKLS